MIGFYDYTVILTYISLFSSVVGMTMALQNKMLTAIFCLMFSGLCDMFDGKVASTKKNRSEDHKNFGIQIDSLCDVICFGVFPAIIGYVSGLKTTWGICCIAVYILAGVIRLAFYNVYAEKHNRVKKANIIYLRGLPITSAAFIFPALILLKNVLHFTPTQFYVVFMVVMYTTALLFLVDIRIPKPNNVGKLIMVILGFALFFLCFITINGYYKIV